ncbi:hypothetical protein IKZ40_09445 [bacterium]|nr:hypothetical protein [bacterium]
MGFLGVITFVLLATLLRGKNAFKKWPWRIASGGLLLQAAFLFLLKPEGAAYAFLGKFFKLLGESAAAGGRSVFGSVDIRMYFALNCLCTIIMISAFMGVLYYLGIPQKVISWIAKIFRKLFGIDGSAAFAAACSIFFGVGVTVSILTPYVPRMSKRSLMILLVSSLATISFALMPLLSSMGISSGDLVLASFMSAPSAVMFAALLCPGDDEGGDEGEIKADLLSGRGIADSFAKGALTGLRLAVRVIAMLIAISAAIYFINKLLVSPRAFFPRYPEMSLQGIFGYIGWPFAFLMGVPASECGKVGYVLGCKVVLNEIVAYQELLKVAGSLSPKTLRIATFACCGFANFGTISILFGLVSPLLDKEKLEAFSKLLARALLAAVLASFTTAALLAAIL